MKRSRAARLPPSVAQVAQGRGADAAERIHKKRRKRAAGELEDLGEGDRRSDMGSRR